MNDALVIIPTYDERDNLDMIVSRTLASGAAVDVLVVDDGSPDGTGDLADSWAAREPRVHVMHRTEKAGLGAAYLAGFAWGLERGYDAIVEMDADGSHHPEDLPRLLGLLADDDLVLGSRWVPGGEVENWPLRRELLSRGGSWYTRGALGIRVADTTGGFRAFRASALRRIDLDAVESRGYCFQVDLLWRALQAGLRVVETPITFTERVHGASKMSGSIVRESLTKVTLWGLRRRGRALVELVVRHRRLPSVRATSHRVGPVVRHAQAR
ncbi:MULTISPECIES: polyprenol monophosphomannose synthase [unclassified Frigoribacterium]|uniref:polyprenol monophosphomannose synthase n=1 Tax=unclassified Frigoribacterium TaxID=2627005 RepID=UPI000FA09D8E|nr:MULTISPECIES: polyprenol monophosphomannose synthase [unclassified Frigoribacterium]ROP76026.1 dolichol-phosphate mannosyltransferase [Frigoribacterium sp. PhB107]TDT64584.1 dolichol-phosphate mannosyltransferase [Frigoribacterium sp. PhB116]